MNIPDVGGVDSVEVESWLESDMVRSEPVRVVAFDPAV